MTFDVNPTPKVDGKFIAVGRERFLVKGVAYGTFAPDVDGLQFPPRPVVARDFAMMAAAGINTVRTYTVPSEALMRHGGNELLQFIVPPGINNERPLTRDYLYR